MKDRFKFRVWDNDLQKYHDFQWYVNNCSDLYSVIEYVDENKFIIEQCTGLKDKNDKLIYEGDIVQTTHDLMFNKNNIEDMNLYNELVKQKLIAEIFYDGGDEWINVKRKEKPRVVSLERMPVYWLKDEEFGYEGEELQSPGDYKIIGNIHEN